MPLGSASLSENLQLLSDCHCFNNNEMSNVNSYGSFKTSRMSSGMVLVCHSTTGGWHPLGISSVQRHRTPWHALGGVVLYNRGPAVVAVELSLWDMSVGVESEKKLPQTSPKGCINILMMCLPMFPEASTQSGKVCKLFQWPGKFPTFLEKYLFNLFTSAAFTCLQFLNTWSVLLVRNMGTKCFRTTVFGTFH